MYLKRYFLVEGLNLLKFLLRRRNQAAKRLGQRFPVRRINHCRLLMLGRIFHRLILSLLLIVGSAPVWAVIGLERWGQEVAGTRLLAENGITRAYAEATRFQTEFPTQAAMDKASSHIVEFARCYEKESKQRQIDELNLRSERQALEIRHRSLQQRWLWTVLGGSLLLLSGTAGFLAR